MPILNAEIQVLGRQVPCAQVSFSFWQATDARGRPSSVVRVERLEVILTGEPAGWGLWEELKFDPSRRVSGWVLFLNEAGHPAKRYAFYEAALVWLEFRHDATGTAGRQTATEVELHFAPATVEVDGQRIEAYSVIPWKTDPQTSFRALTKPADPLPSAHLRAIPSASLPVATLPPKVDLMRFDKGKKPLSERPQSKKTGFLGSPRLSKPRLAALAKEASESYGATVQVVKTDEMTLITNNPDVRAMFRTELEPATGQRLCTIYVQKGVTNYELIHELMHAKQYHQLGYEAYWLEQTKLQREEFVYGELMRVKNQWSEAEVTHAADYINYVRYGKWPTG